MDLINKGAILGESVEGVAVVGDDEIEVTDEGVCTDILSAPDIYADVVSQRKMDQQMQEIITCHPHTCNNHNNKKHHLREHHVATFG
jgi:hypothetical protein